MMVRSQNVPFIGGSFLSLPFQANTILSGPLLIAEYARFLTAVHNCACKRGGSSSIVNENFNSRLLKGLWTIDHEFYRRVYSHNPSALCFHG
jgi:hypothetical protein